jgi:site-specific DNA recombinase
MRNVAIYARISEDREGDGLGVTRQVQDCEAEAQRRGWSVAEVYIDDDISAHSGKLRPAYRRMLEDIAYGTRDAVLVWHLDRLHRQPIELEEFANVCDKAGTKLATMHGDVDFGTGDGMLVARIMAAVAANESDAKSRRVSRKMDELAAKGAPHGGARAFGFEDDKLTVRPAEAEIVAVLAERFLAGESLISLTNWLNGQGVATAGTADTWRTSSVRRMLYSARISGQRDHRGEIVGPAQWPAIITPAQTARIRAKLDDPTRRTNRTARRYLLAGMLRCQGCGSVLLSHPRNRQRRYVCKAGEGLPGCGHTYIDAARVEELIAGAVLYRLDTPELADVLAGRQRHNADTAELTEQIGEDEAQLEELAGLYAEKKITAKEWMTARNPIEARLQAARRTAAQRSGTADLARYIGQGDALRAQWSSLNLDRQRAVVATLLDHAVVGPPASPRGFDPGRVRAVWRL